MDFMAQLMVTEVLDVLAVPSVVVFPLMLSALIEDYLVALLN